MIDGHHSDEVPHGGGSGEAHILATARSFADALTGLCPGELPDAALSELLVDLDAEWNRVQAGRVALLGVWDARVAWAADGAQSGPGWVAARTEQARGAVAGEIRVARGLRAMPVTEQAFLSGHLGYAKVRLLVDLARDLPDAYAGAEAFLVEQVQTVRVDQVPIVLARWRALVDTTGEEARAASQYEARSLHLSPLLDGAWRGDANFTSEAGEIIRNAVDRRARAIYRAEKTEADTNGTTVRSTAAQRRHDALLELILQATTAGDSGNGLNVPAITAIIDITKLPDAKPAEIVGETEAGTPVPAATALRWCCDAGISRILTDTTSTPVDLGHTARLPSPAQRRALAARDRGCTFPGCDRPPGWTSAHHLIHWIHGGPTSLWNQTLLCSFHHHRVHEGGFGLERLANGELRCTRPDGTLLTVPKRRWNDAA
jgi:hypothetical protein